MRREVAWLIERGRPGRPGQRGHIGADSLSNAGTMWGNVEGGEQRPEMGLSSAHSRASEGVE